MSGKSNRPEQESVDFIDFYDVWRVLLQYKHWLALYLSAALILAVYVVSNMTPTFVSTVTLLLDEQRENALSLPGGLDIGLGLGSDDKIVTEIEVLRSRNMIAQVLEALDMKNHPSFKQAMLNKGLGQRFSELFPFLQKNTPVPVSPEQDESEQYKMIGMFDSGLSIRAIAQTRMISVSYESSSPTLARDVANTLAELYIQRHEQIFKNNAAREAIWLEERTVQLREQLQILEQTLSDFLESNDLVVIDGVSGLSAAKIKQLKMQMMKEQQRNLELSSTNTLVEQAGMSNLLMLLSVDYVANNPNIRLLRQTEMLAQKKMNELSTVYGGKHPKIIAARGELSEAKLNLNKELQVVAVNTGANLNTSNNMLLELKGKLKQARLEHQHNQKLENQFIRLTREIDSSRQMYEKLLQQSLRNRLNTAAHVGFISVVDPAIAPPYPAKPKKKVIVGMAVMFALALAITTILMLDAMMNDTFRSAADVRKYLGVALLGITAKSSKFMNNKPDFAFWDKRHKGFIESIRTIKTNLLLQLRQDQSKKLIAVTSTLVDEGKSVVAMNLAFSLSGQGKVLLIDADLRCPSIGKRFNLPDEHPGLVELLKGEARFADCVNRDSKSGISILPAGGNCDDPLDLLFSPRFHLLLKRLKHHYRYVVIDSVHTEAVSDAFVIAKKADSLIYVVRANSTKREQVVSLFERLRAQGIEVSGVVATQVDVSNKRNKERFANFYDFENALGNHHSAENT